MLELVKDSINLFEGQLDFTYNHENGRVITIGQVFSFSENGFYIDWAMSEFGGGQFSLGLSKGKWIIDNECMSITSCLLIVETFEKALIEQKNLKIDYILKKLIHKMTPDFNSLTDGLKMIWREGVDDKEDIKNDFKKPVILSNLITSNVFFKHENSIKNNNMPYSYTNFTMKCEVLWKQFGTFCISKYFESENEQFFCLSNNLKKETLLEIINTLENIEIKNKKLNKKQVAEIELIKQCWCDFKKEAKLIGSAKDMTETIFFDKKLQFLRPYSHTKMV